MDDAPMAMWLSGPLPKGVEQVLHRLRRTDGVARVAVMPDVHLAGEFCVGTVVASEGVVFPNAVGGDIGCGMLAMRFDAEADVLADAKRAARLLGLLHKACPARRHHRRTGYALAATVRDMPMSAACLESQKSADDCRLQLGTLGAGNHFLEFQADQEGVLWLMIHTGSRHLGQCVLRHHLTKARRLSTGVMALDADSGAGRDYLHDMEIARLWARENRRLLAMSTAWAVEKVLGAAPVLESLYDCDHNHLVRETHDGRELFVHRKGATAAADGALGIVPGSMGTRSYHTRGRGCAAALHSSSHGAGRALSRAQARGQVTPTLLRQQLRGVWYDARMERSLCEEAPAAYKPIDEVMRAQTDLTAIVRRLRPLLVHKGT